MLALSKAAILRTYKDWRMQNKKPNFQWEGWKKNKEIQQNSPRKKKVKGTLNLTKNGLQFNKIKPKIVITKEPLTRKD